MNRPQTADCINLTCCRRYLQYFLAHLKGEFLFFTLLWFDHFLLFVFVSPDTRVCSCVCVHMSTFIRLESKSEALIASHSKAFGWQAWLEQGVELVEGGPTVSMWIT